MRPELIAPTVGLHAAWLEAHHEWGPGVHEDGFGLHSSDEDDRDTEHGPMRRYWIRTGEPSAKASVMGGRVEAEKVVGEAPRAVRDNSVG